MPFTFFICCLLMGGNAASEARLPCECDCVCFNRVGFGKAHVRLSFNTNGAQDNATRLRTDIEGGNTRSRELASQIEDCNAKIQVLVDARDSVLLSTA